jgi:hypothetical protein
MPTGHYGLQLRKNGAFHDFAEEELLPYTKLKEDYYI